MKLIHLVKTQKQLIADYQQLQTEYEEFKRQEKIKVEQSLEKIYPFLPLISSPVEYKGKPLTHEGIFLFTYRYFNYYLLENKKFVSLKDNRRRPVESRIFDNLSLKEIIDIQGFEILKNLYESISKIFEELQSMGISAETHNAPSVSMDSEIIKKEIPKSQPIQNRDTNTHDNPPKRNVQERDIKPQGKENKTSPSPKPLDTEEDSESDKNVTKQQHITKPVKTDNRPVQPKVELPKPSPTDSKTDKVESNKATQTKSVKLTAQKETEQKVTEPPKTVEQTEKKKEEKKEVLETVPTPVLPPKKPIEILVEVQEEKELVKETTPAVVDIPKQEDKPLEVVIGIPTVVELPPIEEKTAIEESTTKKDTLLSGELILDFSMLSDSPSTEKEEVFELPSELTAKKGEQQSLELDFELDLGGDENKSTEAKILDDISELDDELSPSQQSFFDLTKTPVDDKPRTIIDLTVAHKNKNKEVQEETIQSHPQTIIDLDSPVFKPDIEEDDTVDDNLPNDDFTEFKPSEPEIEKDFVDNYSSDSVEEFDSDFPEDFEGDLDEGDLDEDDVEFEYVEDEKYEEEFKNQPMTNYDEENLEEDEDEDFDI